MKIFPVALVLLLLAPLAQASSVRGFSLPQLFAQADAVVVGQVTSQRSFWNGAHDTIYTEYTIAVETTPKGEHRPTVILRLMGGAVGDVRLSVAGNPSLAIGERVLLATRNQGEYLTLVGMAQGKWSVKQIDGIDYATRSSQATKDDLPLDDVLQRMRREDGEGQQ
jgi:hypothetical protein